MIKKLCVLVMAVCICLPITAFAKEEPCVFFAPQSMNEENEIVVPVYIQNLPKDNDGLCGAEFQFVYDAERFAIKMDENGRPFLGTSSAMLVQNTENAEVSADRDVVSVSYVDFSGGNDTVLRDGPLFYFTLIPKDPDKLWNSDDYYPLRFVADSVNLITLDRQNAALSGMAAEGIDTYVGGYNAFPTFEPPKIEDKIEFKLGSSAVYINGEEKESDATPYVNSEFMVPLRSLAEAVGMEIYWDGQSQTASVFRPYASAHFNINSGDIYINAKRRPDLTKAEIVNDRTFIPVSAVQSLFGDKLDIENNSDSISLEFK